MPGLRVGSRAYVSTPYNPPAEATPARHRVFMYVRNNSVTYWRKKEVHPPLMNGFADIKRKDIDNMQVLTDTWDVGEFRCPI